MNKINVVLITAVSISLELDNTYPYYNNEPFDVYLNDKICLKEVRTNVWTIYDLIPNKEYNVRVSTLQETISFRTKKVDKVLNVIDYINDQENSFTSAFQKAIDESTQALLIVPEGKYYLNPLFLKSDMTLYLKKGAHLIGNVDRNNYPILPEMINIDGENKILSSWEGEPKPKFASLLTIINKKNITIVGEGIIDGNAQNSDWWINHKTMIGAYRPHDLFIAFSKNINIVGVTFENSPSWTIHPFYSSELKFINTYSHASYDSPNTDGLNPESCENVTIKGARFNVGDDCIAIKSGKKIMAEDYYQPCKNIEISNCLMENGHGGVVFGSEMSCGIENVKVEKCLFKGTDRGLRIKTRRGRGDKAIANNIVFDNILMDTVKTPFVINMFYYCDKDGKSEYVQKKSFLPVNENTPYLGNFKFQNIKCINTIVCGGFFYGLPEKPVERIIFDNVQISYKETDIWELPAMMSDIDMMNRNGLYFNNVNEVVLNNVEITGQRGLKIDNRSNKE